MKTEITVQVFGKKEDVLRNLLAQGFCIKEKFELNDWYFTSIEKSRLLNISYNELLKASILVREMKDENGIEQSVCYKNKKIDANGNVIGEEKISTQIGSVKSMCDIFASSGLNNWCQMKNRSIVLNRGVMTFCLQCVDGLGIFIEYEESMLHLGLSQNQKFEALKNEIKQIGLKLGSDFSCKKPYMLLHK